MTIPSLEFPKNISMATNMQMPEKFRVPSTPPWQKLRCWSVACSHTRKKRCESKQVFFINNIFLNCCCYLSCSFIKILRFQHMQITGNSDYCHHNTIVLFFWVRREKNKRRCRKIIHPEYIFKTSSLILHRKALTLIMFRVNFYFLFDSIKNFRLMIIFQS
jgi:hypothetical protein